MLHIIIPVIQGMSNNLELLHYASLQFLKVYILMKYDF